jgi:hypothetical protein
LRANAGTVTGEARSVMGLPVHLKRLLDAIKKHLRRTPGTSPSA